MKGGFDMATVPRSDVYLSLLAAKALSALADLARDQSAWSDSIQGGLQSGIEYCEAHRPVPLSGSKKATPHGRQTFKRESTDSERTSTTVNGSSEVEKIKEFFQELLLRRRRASMAELNAAIDFLGLDAY